MSLGLESSDPVALIDVAAALSNGKMPFPADEITRAAQDQAPLLASADPARLHDAIERAILGRDVDIALEWMHQAGILRVLFPELEATVDLVQEEGRLHKDVWAHTKQVVKQAVRRPHVR
jgi:poly(A) polymerase